ncbi:hypothetical protein PSEUBRA_005821 [Kalmanozyma brasiliensis GHG001]|uniref:Uncharacterized protein n=1 Tax=Kalmanozyma brasiliensis (strain GHG001) TaxID=1365824 RepID=V5EJQ0_KALBG|nr:uncharacterized protein PSEUBRA_005821 [Kalmanozyma brasiliensis GHG001]EST05015.1 hypothetical protein PSEUBRA_005821 [Kalmanozyma brasiliensis GHG001]
MSTTPSPSKRPRIPTSSAAASATGSPFTVPPRGPKSVGPTGASALSNGAMVGLGMSPADTFSPAPGTVDTYGMSGFTPYSTTSPAYAAGGPAGSAASPLSTALAHGSRILSSIQPATPFYAAGGPTPLLPGSRFTPNLAQQGQARQQPSTPQQGSPEHLRLALQHLQTTLLARLESETEAFFDAADSAAAVGADARVVAGKAKAATGAMEDVLVFLEKNGLASLPLLPLPDGAGEEGGGATEATATTEGASIAQPDAASATAATTTVTKEGQTDPTSIATTSTASADAAAQGAGDAASDLTSQIEALQQQARELFDRRQRLKESASMVGGILDS